ncbi:MAG: hypothetical protein ACYC1Q_03475 [Bacteroidia bacterium]
MKAIYFCGVFLLNCIMISCHENLEKEIQGKYFFNWTTNSSSSFFLLNFTNDSLDAHDYGDFVHYGNFQIRDDSLILYLNDLNEIGYKIVKLDAFELHLLDGSDTLSYRKVPQEAYQEIQVYSLVGLHTGQFVDTFEDPSFIHYYKTDNQVRIRLNDAIKDYDDIGSFLEPGHSHKFPEVYCMIGQGIYVSDLYRLYRELSSSGYRKAILITAKSGKNRFEIYEDKFGFVSGSDWYSINIDTALYRSHPELVLHLSSFSDISDSTFRKKDDPYLIQIDPQVTLNVYIQIKEKVKQIATQKGIKFQFIVPGND